MSERLPLPADLLGRRPRPAGIDPQENAVAYRLLDLADRGNYLDAAEQAADLLRGPASDVRLVAVYLAGLFVERGPTALPDVLAHVERLLEGAGSTDTAKARAVGSAMQWLFRTVADRAAFHTQKRDDTWTEWVHSVSAADIEAIGVRSERILRGEPRGAAMLQKVARWAEVKLGPAAERVRVPDEPEVASRELEACEPEPEDPCEPDWDDPDPEPEMEPELEPEAEPASTGRWPAHEPPLSWPQPSPSRTRTSTLPHHSHAALDSPALAELRDKLNGFEIVLEQGDLAKAAVIARDVQTIIEDFDPLTYLPALFARYLRLLRGCIDELELHWSDDSAAAQVLHQLYRADLEGFIEE